MQSVPIFPRGRVEEVVLTVILELDVSNADTPGAYKVQIIESPAGEASATFPLEPSELIERLGDFQQTLLASSVPSRKLLSRSEASVRGVGRRLFDALFSQQALAGVYRASCAVAVERGETLRMVLRVNAPELAVLPWESMFDEAADSYVCRREPLVRHVPVASSPPPLKVQLPLRILALIASPRGLAVLDVEKEKEDLARALAQPIERGSVVLQWLEHTTWPALQDALLTDSWHVVHFIGHGDFDIERDEGVLALENEEGRVHRVTAESFVDLLREAQPMPRLVVLNACESSTSGSTDMFSGAAASLVRGGVSAVTAMQFEISDKAAIAFCRGFYTAIGRGRGVDEAVRSGRVAILGLGDGSLEWITPTLYLRGREAHLFAVSRSPGAVAPEPAREERRGQAFAAAESGDVTSAVPLYDSVLAEDPDDVEVRRARERAVADARPPATAVDALPDGGLDAVPAVYPDRLAEMWTVAKRVGWFLRPSKSLLKPLAMALRPEETVLGCVKLALTAFTLAFAVVVTDQHVHFSIDRPDAGPWRELFSRTPPSFQRAPDHVCIPLSKVVGPLSIVGKCLALPIEGHGLLSIAEWGNPEGLDLLQKYVAQARDHAALK